MALKGTLKDFGLSDIFQLISHQRKTGILHLEDKGKRVAVTFDLGKVVNAESGTAKTLAKERIGDILLKSGLVDRMQLDDVLQEQVRTMKKLGNIIQEKGYITPEQFKAVLTFQIRETLFKIFQWTSGNYRFEGGNVSYDAQLLTPLAAEFVLMEAARIIDEWPGIKGKIPSLDMVFTRLPGAEDKILRRSQMSAQVKEDMPDIDIFGEEKPKPYDGDKTLLTADQEMVFDLIDGQWTVGDIAYRSLLGDFEAARSVVDLLGFGLVKPVKTPASTPRAIEKEGKGQAGKRLFPMFMTFAVLSGVLFAAFSVLSISGYRLLLFSRMTSEKAVMIRRSVSEAQTLRLNLAMHVYRLEKGVYPAAVGDLVQSEFILPSDATYPFAQPYTVRASENGPVIESPED